MPGIKELVGTIATVVGLLYATGNQAIVWSGLYSLRAKVIQEMRQDWGCPSIFDKRACTRWKGSSR